MSAAIEGEIVSSGLPIPGPGRDSKYRVEFNEQARKLCLLGYTDEELAAFFNICVATLNNWKRDIPAFLESIKEGKEAADANVADSLYRRATGETVLVERVIKDEQGKHDVLKISQYIPGDVQAQRLWLLNRRKLNWRDKQEIEHSGSIDIAERLRRADNRLSSS